MNKSQNNKETIDDQLADFTDNILSEKSAQADENPFSPDPELRALEKTVQRLNNAFHNEDPSKVVVQRMRKNIAANWQQQEQTKSESFWKKWIPAKQKWQSQRSRQRRDMAISLAMLFVLMILTIPFLIGTNLDQPAASGQTLSTGFLVAIAGLVLLAVWLYRNK